ncbi:MAG: hypothetical protein ACQEQE_11330, partial [Bacillota bacterium]
MNNTKDPSVKVLKSMDKFIKSEDKSFQADISLNNIENEELSIMKDFNLSFNYKEVDDSFSSSFNLNHSNKKVYNLFLNLENDFLFIDLLDNKNVFSVKVDEINKTFYLYQKFLSYYRNIDLSGLDSKYLKIVNNEMRNKLYLEDSKIHLSLNEKEISELLLKISKSAKDDEKLAKKLQPQILNILKQMKKDDLSELGLDTSKLEVVIKENKSFEVYKENHKIFFEQLIEELEWTLKYIDNPELN